MSAVWVKPDSQEWQDPSGSQRYKRTACGRVTTPQPNRHGYDDSTRTTALRMMALRMMMEGSSFASAGRVLEINPQTVANWVKAHVDNLPKCPAKLVGAPEQVEVDEVFTFVARKNKVYLITAVERHTRCFMSWDVATERTSQTIQAVIDQVPDAFQ